MNRAEAFTEHRPLLFSIAYRMLGSVMDAEDMVQETFMRWRKAPVEEVRAPKSYLSTVVTRLCIDELRSARARREQYIGPWLPEPLITEDAAPVDHNLQLAESLSMAFLVLLERLTPTERAVFLLREVFDYDYAEVARIVEKSEANCRQMVHRARERVKAERPRFDATPEQAERVAQEFLAASAGGDMERLLNLLADDAVLLSDGGGKVVAARNPILGADRVARFLVGVAHNAPPDTEYRFAWINGRPGAVSYVAGKPQIVGSLEIVDGQVRGVYIVVNPDKLKRLPPLQQ